MILYSKNRKNKVYITDVAIKKVPYIDFCGKTKEDNLLLQKASVLVLTMSKYENDSNEVSITIDLTKGDFNLKKEDMSFGISYGDEHQVNVLSDTRSFHIINTSERCSVAISHNHPSTQTFSLEDISFFLRYASIGLFIVVSNQGVVHYLQKTSKYDYDKARKLFFDCSKKRKLYETEKDYYRKAIRFFQNCSKCGIIYM